jgi:methylmalonyl-CoA mutase cobalamin-binding subunit
VAASLGDAGVIVSYLGQERSVHRIAGTAADMQADAVEVCLAGRGGIGLLRELLHELNRPGRREVSIVVHRVL